jgi:MFS family permease
MTIAAPSATLSQMADPTTAGTVPQVLPNPGVTWQAGTLTYTRGGLAMLFFWLLFGDFAMTVASTALPLMLPLHLAHRGLSSEKIGVYMSLGSIAAMIVGPLTGMWSDRMRTRWGRRRPFLLISTPIVAGGMALIPYMESEFGLFVAVTLLSFANAVFGIAYFLYNDVIPGQLMGRFIGAFRLFGFAGALIFQFGMAQNLDTNPNLVWLSCAALSLIGHLVVPLMVKEGTYGPPPPKQPVAELAKQFVGDGFGSTYIWMLWLTLGMTALGGPAANFFTIFYEKDLGMSTGEIAKMMGWGTAIAMVMALPAGWLVDRVGVRRLWCLATGMVGICQIMMYVLSKDVQSGFILYLVYYSINMLLAAALLPMIFAHLPKDRFGQLVSSQTLLVQALLSIGSIGVGWLIGATGHTNTAFLYGGVIYLLSPIFVLLMHHCRNPFAGESTSMSATPGG